MEYDKATGSEVDERMGGRAPRTEPVMEIRRGPGRLAARSTCAACSIGSDCLIAAVAIRHRAALLTADQDLARIATVMDLQLDPASV